MEYLKFILYGLIQGLTEFIPISSTAHLKIISLFFGIEDPGSSISAIIQIGSVLALLWYFKNEVFYLKNESKKTFYKNHLNKKLLKSIFFGTLPIVFIGGTIKLFIPNFFNVILRSNISIAIVSILMACLMYLSDISKNNSTNISNHNYRDSLLIGLAQAFAIIPGVSRSGSTISVALLSGWERSDAAKFSFLLGIPAISLAAISEFVFSFNRIHTFDLLPLIVGITTAFLSSLFAIDFLIKYLSTRGMKLFVYYRLFFGILILLNL